MPEIPAPIIGWIEQSTGGKPAPCDVAVIANVSTHFEAARDLLRMVSFDSGSGRKIGRTAQHQIELLFRTKDLFLAKITHP